MRNRILILLLTLCLLAGVFSPGLPMAAADTPVYSGECGAEGDNLLWRFDPESGTLSFTGSGAMTDYERGADRPWDVYTEEILHVELPEGLTHLGIAALIRCSCLTELTLPESLTSIGDQALAQTDALTELTIPDAVTEASAPLWKSGIQRLTVGKGLRELTPYFCASCPNLTEVTLSEGLETIGAAAFYNCPALRTVRLPDSLTMIDQFAFNSCAALEDIRFPGKLQQIGYAAFCLSGLTEARLPDSLTSLGESSIRSCYGLAQLSIGSGLTEIPGWAFSDACFTELSIPENVRSIGEGAFYYCAQLETVSLAEGLELIGEYAFFLAGLKTVTIPASTTDVARGAFGRCTELTGIAVAAGSRSYRSADGVLLTADGRTLEQYPAGKSDERYTVPDGVETIRASAMECAPFSEIVFPDSLKTIGENALLDCANLKSVTIPAGVTEIGEHALGFSADLATDEYTALEGFTVYGYSGSAAETYAAENGLAFVALTVENPFVDVKPGGYYYSALLWALLRGVTNGTSDTTFSPSDPCTRGQIVTFLWRTFGKPEPGVSENPFADVPEGKYYTKAVLWAVENKITNGTSETEFSPDSPCTRGQIVTFLWRANGEPEPNTSEHPFADVPEGKYYTEAVLWAVENKITNGTSKTEFSPDAPCTRAQIVTFLYRCVVQP